MRLVEVSWYDSLGSSGWEKSEAKLAEMVPSALIHRSVGWVLRDDDSGLVVAASRNESDSGPWMDNVADATYIPRASIIQVREWADEAEK